MDGQQAQFVWFRAQSYVQVWNMPPWVETGMDGAIVAIIRTETTEVRYPDSWWGERSKKGQSEKALLSWKRWLTGTGQVYPGG